MDDKIVVYKFTQNIVGYIDQDNLFRIKCNLNSYHIGTETIPSILSMEDIPDKLKEVYGKIQIPLIVEVYVEIYSDGSRKITLTN